MVIYIFWTCRDQSEAKQIIYALLEQKLIACASLFPEVESIYRWEGSIEESTEVKVILKTQSIHFESILNYINTHCTYEVPEIAQIDITRANPRYHSWLIDETSL